MRLFTALLAATLALNANGRAQILPALEFAARDGRPGPGKTWKLSDAKGQALAARMNAVTQKTPIVVDYDHQTITAPNTGAKAPAAGWIESVEWLAGEGLFAKVKWTAAAKGYIDAEEYKYMSPVIQYDEATGEITDVLLAALVNYPGILGMQAVEAALAAQFSNSANHQVGQAQPGQQPEIASMTLLAQLATLLALAPTAANDAAVLAAVQTLKATADAASARPAVPAALAAELGLQPGVDEAAAVAALAGLKTKATSTGGLTEGALAQITALSAQVAALQAAATDAQVQQLADGAIAAGKFVPAFRDELIKMGKASLATLSSMVAAAPVIPGLAGQSATAAAAAAAAATGGAQGAAMLSSAEALGVAANMGIKPDAWAAALAKAA